MTTISDFYSARQWHATGMYRDFLRGFEHEIMLCLPGGPGRTLRLTFLRGSGPDFSDRDRALPEREKDRQEGRPGGQDRAGAGARRPGGGVEAGFGIRDVGHCALAFRDIQVLR